MPMKKRDLQELALSENSNPGLQLNLQRTTHPDSEMLQNILKRVEKLEQSTLLETDYNTAPTGNPVNEG